MRHSLGGKVRSEGKLSRYAKATQPMKQEQRLGRIADSDRVQAKFILTARTLLVSWDRTSIILIVVVLFVPMTLTSDLEVDLDLHKIMMMSPDPSSAPITPYLSVSKLHTILPVT